jgi:hypothetical protein
MFDHYPIHHLIENQAKRLRLRRNELARRCGFKNLAKGLRRIDGVCHGDLDSPGAKMVLDNLAAALEVDQVEVEEAIAATAEIIAEANRLAEAKRDAAWRKSFKPHAYLVGSQNRPSQITFYGITGGAERWLKIPLDLSQPPVTYALQAHEFVAKTPFVPYHGRTTGFIVNYTPDSAVRFDLDGSPVEHFKKAYIPGQVEVFIGKQKLPAKGLFGI